MQWHIRSSLGIAVAATNVLEPYVLHVVTGCGASCCFCQQSFSPTMLIRASQDQQVGSHLQLP
jgi:hypothetical protein